MEDQLLETRRSSHYPLDRLPEDPRRHPKSRYGPRRPGEEGLPGRTRHDDYPPLRKERMMAGHSRWKTLQAKRLAETADAVEHPEYEQAGRDLRLGDQLRS